MNSKRVKFVHEGQYVAEVEVELVESENSWSPTLSLEDVYKLDDVRSALKTGNLQAAAEYGRVYELRPISGAR